MGTVSPAGCQVGAGQWSRANGHLLSLSIALIVLSGGTEHLVKWDRDSISKEQIDSAISCHLALEGATHRQGGEGNLQETSPFRGEGISRSLG